MGDVYSVFLNGSTTAATTLTTNLFSSGRVALYDFSGQVFDNVSLSTSAPEPSGLALLSLGALGLVGYRRRFATR